MTKRNMIEYQIHLGKNKRILKEIYRHFPLLDEEPPLSIIAEIFGVEANRDAHPIASVRASQRFRDIERDEKYDGVARDELHKLLEIKGADPTEQEIEQAYQIVRKKWTPNYADEVSDHTTMRLAWIQNGILHPIQ